jgi:hypothetical protein
VSASCPPPWVSDFLSAIRQHAQWSIRGGCDACFAMWVICHARYFRISKCSSSAILAIGKIRMQCLPRPVSPAHAPLRLLISHHLIHLHFGFSIRRPASPPACCISRDTWCCSHPFLRFELLVARPCHCLSVQHLGLQRGWCAGGRQVAV